jgi:hypothetical protein
MTVSVQQQSDTIKIPAGGDYRGELQQQQRERQWAAAHGLRHVGWRCPHWLVRRRQCQLCEFNHRGLYHWMDHVTGWAGSDGSRVLVCQPYHFGIDDMVSLTHVCAQLDLDADINSKGFYGYGTICIELRRQSKGL